MKKSVLKKTIALSLSAASLLSVGVLAHADSCGFDNSLLEKQNKVINSDGSVTIFNPFVIYKNKKSPLIHWAFPNSYELMTQNENYNCKMFGLGSVTNTSIQTLDQTELEKLGAVYVDSDDNGKTVYIVGPTGHWPKNDVYTSLTCRR